MTSPPLGRLLEPPRLLTVLRVRYALHLLTVRLAPRRVDFPLLAVVARAWAVETIRAGRHSAWGGVRDRRADDAQLTFKNVPFEEHKIKRGGAAGAGGSQTKWYS